MAHHDADEPELASLELLRRGRHFRISWKLKVIVGRDEEESVWLAERAGDRWNCQTADGRGALLLMEGEADEESLAAVARLAARYSRHRTQGKVAIRLWRGSERRELLVGPASDELLERWRIAPPATTPERHGML
jgi:hypothetical protein